MTHGQTLSASATAGKEALLRGSNTEKEIHSAYLEGLWLPSGVKSKRPEAADRRGFPFFWVAFLRAEEVPREFLRAS